MAGRVKQSDIEELKARANLVDIISGYVSLKPASHKPILGQALVQSYRSWVGQ